MLSFVYWYIFCILRNGHVGRADDLVCTGELFDSIYGRSAWLSYVAPDYAKGLYHPARTVLEGRFKIMGASYVTPDTFSEFLWTYNEKDGISKIEMPYGDYYLAEIEASTGYRLLEDSISFTIDKESTIINIYNERVEVPDTSINPIICITISILFFIFGTIILIFSHNNKKINILCIIIMILSCLVITIYHFKSYYDKTKNTKAVEAFLNNKIDNNYDEKYRYKALQEIPSLNIKRGI